jgi:hypothetical protein
MARLKPRADDSRSIPKRAKMVTASIGRIAIHDFVSQRNSSLFETLRHQTHPCKQCFGYTFALQSRRAAACERRLTRLELVIH